MKTKTLTTRPRAERGSRACLKLRRGGEIPVNLYKATQGDGPTQLVNHALAASAYDVMQLLAHHDALLEVAFGGGKELAVVREVQRDAFGDDVLHVDLQVIDATKPIAFEVELAFKGEAKGVRSGGRLMVQKRRLAIRALPSAIPESIEVRLDDLDIDQYLHVGELTLPAGVELDDEDPKGLVVHVAPAATEAELAAGAAASEGAEPEVIGKPKEDEAAAAAAPAPPAKK